MKKIFIALTMLFVCIGIYFAYANISDQRTIKIIEFDRGITLPVRGDAKKLLNYIESKTEDKNKKNVVIRSILDKKSGGTGVVVTDKNKNVTSYEIFGNQFSKTLKTANGETTDDVWYHMDSETYKKLETLMEKLLKPTQ